MTMKIAYSILTSNFFNLGEELNKMTEAGIDLFHLDIMDGQFVPNISFGPRVIECIKKESKTKLDCHLMIDQPERFMDKFIEIGPEMISFHFEATKEHKKLINDIRKNDIKVGMAISPLTKAKEILPFIKDLDFVLQMTVNPGFGGQSFLIETVENLDFLNRYRKENDLSFEIQVDGGINEITSRICHLKGVDIMVAGSHLYKSNNYEESINRLKYHK